MRPTLSPWEGPSVAVHWTLDLPWVSGKGCPGHPRPFLCATPSAAVWTWHLLSPGEAENAQSRPLWVLSVQQFFPRCVPSCALAPPLGDGLLGGSGLRPAVPQRWARSSATAVLPSGPQDLPQLQPTPLTPCALRLGSVRFPSSLGTCS